MSIWSPSLMVELVTFWARTLLWWWVNLTRKSSKILDQLFQYFKIKFGFDAVLWDWQLEKIENIFIKENLEIHSTKLNLTQKMNQSWQAVGGVDKSMGGFMAPHEEFLRNIERYRFNRLLDIGRYIRLRNMTSCRENSYPREISTVSLAIQGRHWWPQATTCLPRPSRVSCQTVEGRNLL